MKPEGLGLVLMWLLCLTLAFLLLSFIFSNHPRISSTPISKPNQEYKEEYKEQYKGEHTEEYKDQYKEEHTKCELFKGKWIWDSEGPSYSNWSCSTIPDPNNCPMYGREDTTYVNWKWKPDQCELPRFNPKNFLNIVRGKTMAFIGDSVAKNQVESLLCLLSPEESPIIMYKEDDNFATWYYFRTWYYPTYDFTLKMIWSAWLVKGGERVANSAVFHLGLDKVDDMWSKQLPDIDYAILSGTHWFVRDLYLYKNGTVVGCMNCNDTKVNHVGMNFAFQLAFRTALKYISDCEDCKGLVTWVRTSSPSHFEGSWVRGKCNRTSLLSLEQAMELNLGGTSMEFRRIQVEEVERIKKKGWKRGVKFELFDITDAMMMRPDGHPDIHWDNKYMPGYSDCIHWCLPGPIDAWNDLLLALIANNGSD